MLASDNLPLDEALPVDLFAPDMQQYIILADQEDTDEEYRG